MEYFRYFKSPFLIALMLVALCSTIESKAQPHLNVEFKIQSRESLQLNDVRITMVDNKTAEKKENYSIDTMPALYDLDFNNKYTFTFDHPDYYDKSIEISTFIPKKYDNKTYTVEIELTMDFNCEQNPNYSSVIFKPLGRIEFNRAKKKFDYDASYTFKMGERYEKRKKERCDLVAEAEKFRKKMIKLEEAKNNDPGKLLELKRQQEQIAAIEKLQLKTIDIQKEESLEEIRLEKQEEDDRIAANEKKKENKVINEAPKTRQPLFDKTQPQIHIFPKGGWPSELANSILDAKYKPKPIGTFTYDLSKGRKDFYVSDADELKEKFPDAFNKAFPNWNYIVETNTKYKNRNK